MFDSDVA